MTPPLRRLLLWAPVALLLAYEFFLSSQPDLPGPPLPISSGDKLGHAAYFFLVASLAYRALRFGERRPRRRAAWTVVLATLAWGVLDEWHQSFVPGRETEALDVAADAAGALLAALVSERIWRRFEPGAG